MKREIVSIFNSEDIKNIVQDILNPGTPEEVLVFENTQISMKEFKQYAGSSFYLKERNTRGDVILEYGKYFITLPEESVQEVGITEG
jgi:hypothetical protein